MPEGDSIRRIADQLAPLVGQALERVTTRGLERDLAGRTVTAVQPYGKHLMIDLDDGTQIRTHLGMNGRVRRFTRAEGEPRLARMSPGRATLVLVTRSTVVMWVDARIVEIAGRRAPMRGLAVAALGPDVLADGFDPRHAASRALAHPSRTIGDVLLDQRVAAGLGNIWRCEALFACAIDPRTPVHELSSEAIAALYAKARELMLAGLAPAARFAGRPPYAVYERCGQPCPRCSASIEAFLVGDPPRRVWMCSRCQRGGGRRGDES